MSDGVIRLDDYDTELRFGATIVSSERITPDAADAEVRELVLDVERPDFPFRVGRTRWLREDLILPQQQRWIRPER